MCISSRSRIQPEEENILVKAGPLLAVVGNWQELLASDLAEQEYEYHRRHERSGWPLGDDTILARLERMITRVLRKTAARAEEKILKYDVPVFLSMNATNQKPHRRLLK